MYSWYPFVTSSTFIEAFHPQVHHFMRIGLIHTLVLLALLSFPGWAQEQYRVSDQSQVVVRGTSTLHDWESRVEEVEGAGTFIIENGTLKEVHSLRVSFKAKSLKSGKDKMDKLTYDALKADEHPAITFTFAELTSRQGDQLEAKGKLEIAGQSREVNVTGAVTIKDRNIVITGSHPVLMTDHGIEPPTAMLGAIKTGDEVTVNFEIALAQ